MTRKNAGMNVMWKGLRDYYGISKELILIFLKLCVECELKKGTPKKGIVVKPIVSKEQNEKCQVDLIDLQACPDDEYKYIIVYQDQEREDQNNNRNVGDENKMGLMVLEQREQDIEVQRSGAREAQQEQAQKMELMVLEQRKQDIEVQQPMSSQQYVPEQVINSNLLKLIFLFCKICSSFPIL